MRNAIISLAAVAALLLSSCTDEQIARAEAVSAAAQARVDQAAHAVELAQAAVDKADALARDLGSVKAEQVVGQAREALQVAVAAKDLAKSTADVASAAVASAKAAQAAGGSTFDILIAVAGTAVPMAVPLLAALKALWNNRSALRQIVAGVEKAKQSMPSDQVDKLHQALAITTDDRTKQQVATIKAAA